MSDVATSWGPRVDPRFRAILERSPVLTRDQWVVVCGEMLGRRLPTPARRGGMSGVWDLVRADLASGA